jgi:hypothetical protein
LPGGSLARGDCCSGARHEFGSRVRWHHRCSRARPGEDLRPVCFCPRELRWACVAAAPTERVGEKVFYGRHLFAAKPKVKLCPELVSDVECAAARPSLAYLNFAFFEVSLIDDVLYSPGWAGPRCIAGRLLARIGFHAAPRSPRHRQRRCLPSLVLRKAVFYQRTAGSSSAKEPQEAPRESQRVRRIFPLDRRGNRSVPARTKHRYREAQIVQSNVRQQESYQQQKYIMTTALEASNAAPRCSSSRLVCHPL